MTKKDESVTLMLLGTARKLFPRYCVGLNWAVGGKKLARRLKASRFVHVFIHMPHSQLIAKKYQAFISVLDLAILALKSEERSRARPNYKLRRTKGWRDDI